MDKELNYEIIINPIFLRDNKKDQVVILQGNNVLAVNRIEGNNHET